jgi:hypothetical protein
MRCTLTELIRVSRCHVAHARACGRTLVAAAAELCAAQIARGNSGEMMLGAVRPASTPRHARRIHPPVRSRARLRCLVKLKPIIAVPARCVESGNGIISGQLQLPVRSEQLWPLVRATKLMERNRCLPPPL